MTQTEIKSECWLAFKQIEEAERALVELRKECKHPNTFTGNYSYRVGAISIAIICSDCYHCVEILSGSSEK